MSHLSNIRYEFPFFRLHPDISYLDYAATTFMPDRVLDKWRDYHQRTGIATGRSRSFLGREAARVLEDARKDIKKYFNASATHELIFVKNTTEALNMAAWGLRHTLQKGDLLLLTALEHHSNFLPWQRIAQMAGAMVIEVPLNRGVPDEEFLKKFNHRGCRLLALSHTSNVNGAMPDIGLFSEFAREQDALVILDAAQGAAHANIDIQSLDVDCIAVSAHKMYGPKNIGALFVRKELLTKFDPLLLGGGMVWQSGEKPTWLNGPPRLEGGTFDPGLATAWAESCLFISEIGLKGIMHHELELGNQLRKGLQSIDGINILEGGNSVTPGLVSFNLENIHPHDLESSLDSKNIIVRSGHLCAQSAIRHLGYQTVVRASIGIGSQKWEIDNLLDALSYASSHKSWFNFTKTKNNNIIVAPDNILAADGLACGDSLHLEVAFTNDICEFHCEVQGCSLCENSAELMEQLSGFSLQTIHKAAMDFINFAETGNLSSDFPLELEGWKSFPNDRKECVLAPWRLLLNVSPSCSATKTDSIAPLACDACVRASKIQWFQSPQKGTSENGICKKIKNFWMLDRDSDSCWQSLAKLHLSHKERNTLEKKLTNFNPLNSKILKKLKIVAPIYNNAIDIPGGNIPGELNLLAQKQYARQLVIKKEFIRIMSFIREKNLDIRPIKGALTSTLYPVPYLRAYLDHDMIASSAKHAFTLGSWLLSEGYHFLSDGSVPLSLKNIVTEGLEFAGHYHLEKVLYDKYQMVVDISFPAFPLARNRLFYCSPQAEHIWEDQIVITACHLFKHDVVYMKDINDICMILINRNIDRDYLEKRIDELGMEIYFSILSEFIRKQIDDKIFLYNMNILHTILSKAFLRLGWPYSRRAHCIIKALDMARHSLNSKGILCSCKDLLRMSIGKKYTSRRMYLFPLVLFKKYFDFSDFKCQDFVLSKDGILGVFNNHGIMYALTPIGIFLASNDVMATASKQHVNDFVIELLKKLKISKNEIHHAAICESRSDLWLF